ncbi:MAG: hypothetical protein A2039_01820 [Candidatus Melainabacteria bacterium GWA2_34_9]|nr:MAG: hypothetical protein A2039_01820 [Candidatus Melainabacteria bacterium GWA2_34_9]
MLFSERIGIKSTKLLQINSIDDDLRNSLWNVFIDRIINANYFENIAKEIWKNFLKKPVDDIPLTSTWTDQTKRFSKDWIKSIFLKSEYYVVYDLLEFIIVSLKKYHYVSESFIKNCKEVLEKEKSGYKIINNQVVPISSEIEVHEIEESLENSQNDKFKFINNHLNQAIEHFKNRENPDYKNSIHEAIKAVECLCRLITGESDLGKSLNNIEKFIMIHPQFKSGLEKFYAYTNSKEVGARHAQMLDSNIGFDEAKFMLVFCSAFINYLISKRADAKPSSA